MSRARRRALIQRAHPGLSLVRQCALTGLSRASLYVEPRGESEASLALMRMIDAQHLLTPWYGSRQMARHLRRQGWAVNRKRIQRLMRLMHLTATAPAPGTSRPAPNHPVYPYLLRGLAIEQPNQVWATDITYIPMAHGFLYLVAIMDWYSRRVLAWRLSNTLDTAFCVEALEEALARFGAPEIFNTDQGAQFSARAWIDTLKAHDIRISMDGKGRWMDNVFVERLWRSLKYECIYLNAFETPEAARQGIGRWMDYYDEERPHSSLDGFTPAEVHAGLDRVKLAA